MNASVASAPELLLELRNLRKSFASHLVLKDIDLSIYRGDIVAVIGPSGCGKSTLLRCLNGLELRDGGEISFQGRLVENKEAAWHELRPHIGMVFQSYELFPHLSVLDNLTLAPRLVKKRSREEAEAEAFSWLRKLRLEDKAQAFPRQLSGGQRQRIAIARALCLRPDLMLFDEVTAALDPEMVREVLDAIQGLAAEGMTMLLVTHEMGFARHVANRIVFLDQGRIVEEGDPHTFFEAPSSSRAQAFLDTLLHYQTPAHPNPQEARR